MYIVTDNFIIIVINNMKYLVSLDIINFSSLAKGNISEKTRKLKIEKN